MADIPTIVTAAGLQPTPPATLQAALIAGVTATNPDYTANLPAIMIEDISSTDVLALTTIDQAKVETVNSLTPYGANDFLLIQLGNMAGITQAPATNSSVYCVFTGTVGFLVVEGFVVTDGTYQYVVQDGGIVGTSGSTDPLYCLAVQSGSWPIPSGVVTQLVTAVPTGITLSVTNPSAGTGGGAAQSSASFRQAVLQANMAISQGMTTLLKTLLAQVPGVQARLVSVAQQTGGGWEVIVGGGDPYQVGAAIFDALFDVSSLVGSVLNIITISFTNPAVITTDKNHGYSTGQIVIIQDAQGVTNINNIAFPATVTGERTFTIPLNPAGSGYTGGGISTPDFRNITVAINDYPDVYDVIFVNPPPLTVAMTVTWNTISTSFVSPAAIAQLAGPALADYVNSVVVGQPLNILSMEAIFLASVANILASNLVSELTFSVDINGIGVAPVGSLIYGEPFSAVQEGYFTTNTGLITIVQA